MSDNWYTANDPPSWCFSTQPTDYYFYQHSDQANAFCEGYVYPHQWVSCITDFWILGMAFWQFMWDHNFGIMRFATGCIAVNAVGSFFNHWYGTRQWKIMDSSTMFVEMWIVCTVVWEATYKHQRLLFNQRQGSIQVLDWGRPIIKGIMWTICSFVIFILLFNEITGCAWKGSEALFTFAIGVPLGALALNWLLFVKYAKKADLELLFAERKWPKDTFKKSKTYMAWGIAITIGSAAVWILVHSLCRNNHWLGYLPGHGIWHVGMSYGLSFIEMWFIMFASIFSKEYFAYKTTEQRLCECPCQGRCADCCNRCLQKYFPIVTNNVNYTRPDGFHTCACCKFCCDEICSNCKKKEEELDDVVNKEDEEKGTVKLEVVNKETDNE